MAASNLRRLVLGLVRFSPQRNCAAVKSALPICRVPHSKPIARGSHVIAAFGQCGGENGHLLSLERHTHQTDGRWQKPLLELIVAREMAEKIMLLLIEIPMAFGLGGTFNERIGKIEVQWGNDSCSNKTAVCTSIVLTDSVRSRIPSRRAGNVAFGELGEHFSKPE